MKAISCPKCGNTRLKCINNHLYKCPYCDSLFDDDIRGEIKDISKSINGFLIEDGTIQKYNGENIDLVIPEGVTSIGPGAFASLGKYSFRNDDFYIRSVRMPRGVSEISISAFSECSELETVITAPGLRRINAYAFQNCKSLKSISLSEGLKIIKEGAFCGCKSLKVINFPDGLEFIGDHAFQDCTSLEEVKLPESVKQIGRDAFNGCTALKTVILPEDIQIILNGTFKECKSLQRITLPENLKEIEECAFYNCSSLAGVNIPDGVDIHETVMYKPWGNIGAFHGCDLSKVSTPVSRQRMKLRRCRYCGGRFIGSLFNKSCDNCGKKKDY